MRRWTGILGSAVLGAAVVCGAVVGAAPPKPAAPAADPPKGLPAEPPPTTVKQMLTPTRMNFQCKGRTPDSAIELLEQQIGYSLRPPTEEGPVEGRGKINLDDQNQPVLAVIQHICQQGDLVISRTASRIESSIVLNSRQSEGADCYFPKVVDSSVMPIVTRMSVNNSNFRGVESRRLFVSIALVTEPKVFIVGYYRGDILESAIDDQNRTLVLPPNTPGPGMGMNRPLKNNGFNSSDGVSVSCTINYPAAPAIAVKRLRGSVKVALGLNVQSRDLSAVLKGGETASLPFMKNNNIVFSDFDIDPKDEHGYALTMTVPRVRVPSGKMVEDSPELAQLRFEAIDATNRKWRVRKGNSKLMQGNTVQYTVTLRPPVVETSDSPREKPPTKFSVLIPGKTEDVSIPFEFNDLPIPAVQN